MVEFASQPRSKSTCSKEGRPRSVKNVYTSSFRGTKMKIPPRINMRKIFALLPIIVAAVAVMHGSSPKLELSWKNPDYTGGNNFKNIMVLALNGKAGNRAQFEDEMVAAIAETGIQAQPSYAYLPRPDATPIDMTNMRWVVQTQKFDAILVSCLTKRDSTTTYVPGQVYTPLPFYGTFYGYYGALYPVIYSPEYMMTERVAQVQTNLYSTAKPDGQLVWTGTTNTFDVGSVMNVIKDLVKVTVKELEKQDILHRPR
jgi:hypothetical protein